MNKYQIFLVSPSFYAVLSGALLSVTIGFLGELFSFQQGAVDHSLMSRIFTSIAFTISSVCFLNISVVLEESRGEVGLRNLLDKINSDTGLQHKLWSSMLIGSLALFLALVSIATTLYYTLHG